MFNLHFIFAMSNFYIYVKVILIVKNCGSRWPKYCYGDIKFTLGITINVDIYLFYKRFLEYSSIHIARVLALSSITDLL